MIKAAEAEHALRLVREAILGYQAIQDAGESDNFDSGLAAVALVNAMSLLDLFLTQDTKDSKFRMQQVLLLLVGHKEVRCPLADDRTVLVLRWPTKADPRVVYPVIPKEAPIEVRRRWRRIDNPNSEAVAFSNEVTHGRT